MNEIHAFLHDDMGRCVATVKVHPAAPEYLDHEGKRYELLEVETSWARYAEPLRDG